MAPKTHKQELLEAEAAHAKAAKEYATKKADYDAAGELAPHFISMLKNFEEYVRANKIPQAKALVLASAVHASVEQALLTACGVQKEDTEEEMKRIDDLHTSVHGLSHLGRRVERHVVTMGVATEEGQVGGPVAGVGKMVLDDKSDGKGG